MKLSFVIPAYNEEKNIAKCIKSILREKDRKNYDIEIIVVNNASTDRTGEIARSFKQVRTIDEPRKGIVWARHAGYLASKGDLIANIDADNILLPGWLDKVFSEFKNRNDLIALSGPYIYYDLPKWQNSFVKIYYISGKLISLITHNVILQGGNYVISKNVLEKIGGYDVSIQFYGEDANIAHRIKNLGKTKFSFSLPVLSSGRRLVKEGIVKIGFLYGINYLWTALFKQPLTKKYKDIRI